MEIVCIGDSLTFGYGVEKNNRWTEILNNRLASNIINRGVSGETTTQIINRFQRNVLSKRPDKVFIMGGSNDLIFERAPKKMKDNIIKMVQLASYNNIIPIIGIQPLTYPEMASKFWTDGTDYVWINDQIQLYRNYMYEFANKKDIDIIDFYGLFTDIVNNANASKYYIDGLHPTAKGNLLMAEQVIKSRVFE
ncbi:GDSL-type esterase/lipase family protein [Clostridiisalibacter paucivorans]|uniref:GDSL-type esterase/lipase family protein n=1 Tax=Clostridiisalibacter paucivorans TaxID=408753 RepID=UPI00047EEE9C|nr:GDSL-type esterase/lipase family protein [Clostridiisalibacter paucivorans]